MRNNILFCGFLSVFILASCSGNKEESKTVSAKKDSSHINPLHPPDSIPVKHGAIAGEDVDTNFRQFAFVAANQFIILNASPDTNWAKGKPVFKGGWDSGIYAALTDVKTEALPQTYSSLLNTNFKVFTGYGEMQLVKVTSFKLLSAYIPHFGTVQGWDHPEEGKAFTEEQKAAEIWKTAGLYLVAEFKMQGDKEILFAVPENRNSEMLAWDKEIAEQAGKKIKSAAQATADYAEAEKTYREQFESKTKWWEHEDASSSMYGFKAKSGEQYVILSETAGSPCGGDFYASVFSIWKADKKLNISLLHLMKENMSVAGVLDMENDGIPEFLLEDGFGKQVLLKKNGNEWVEFVSWTIPFMDCPC